MKFLLFFTIFLSTAVSAKSYLAQVEAQFIRGAENPHHEPCITSEDDKNNGFECVNVQLSHWHVYAVKVKEVLLGEDLPDTLDVGIFMHGQFNQKFASNFYLLISEETDQSVISSLGTKFVGLDFDSPSSTPCFEYDLESSYPEAGLTSVSPSSIGAPEDYYCYKVGSK